MPALPQPLGPFHKVWQDMPWSEARVYDAWQAASAAVARAAASDAAKEAARAAAKAALESRVQCPPTSRFKQPNRERSPRFVRSPPGGLAPLFSAESLAARAAPSYAPASSPDAPLERSSGHVVTAAHHAKSMAKRRGRSSADESARSRQMDVSEAEALAMLGELRMFHKLSPVELRMLYGRASIVHFSRYSTIIREGIVGATFYIVLSGRVRVLTELAGLDIVFPNAQGRRHFGEAALVAAVKREATITALEECELLAVHKTDIEGLPVDLSDVRKVLCANMLSKIPFFRDLELAVREQLGDLLDIQYTDVRVLRHRAHATRPHTQHHVRWRSTCERRLFAPSLSLCVQAQHTIFREGDVAEALYVLVEGTVVVERCNAVSGAVDRVATYNVRSEQRYFGERALWTSEPRAATARAIEPTNLLVVRTVNFAALLEILPQLNEIFGVNTNAFDTLNRLRRESSTGIGVDLDRMKELRRRASIMAPTR